MSTMLYLDTARLGQMSPTALKMQCDFVRLMAEDPSSLYTEQFLFEGVTATPEIPQRFPELTRWPGIEGLKQQLRQTFAENTTSDTKVLLASRTTSLMQSGIRSLVAAGRRHLLLTDLTWPPYRKWIQSFARLRRIRLSLLPLRKRIWQQGFTADDVAREILKYVRRNRSDSLFLPAVTHTGIRLPLPTILRSLSDSSTNVRTVIDASQAYGHINTGDWTHLADFTFGGCHKWVRSYLPLGVGFARQRDGTRFRKELSRDPLFQFCDATALGKGPMETVNVTPLLTAQGAVTDLVSRSSRPRSGNEACECRTRLKRCPGWRILTLPRCLRSNIILIQSAELSIRRFPKHRLRQLLAEHRISATTYGNGVVRISIPDSNPDTHRTIPHLVTARLSRLKGRTQPRVSTNAAEAAICCQEHDSQTPVEMPSSLIRS
ncbi:hypothetical protein [Fuerstiella marisgermanici]|uniref:Aminotransferase class V domain-containing protein n=1 Tax=Fuerstiella marisgermanici TaxID=1891926 RepID=A0A1P8WGM3_9PLAN|nr:hypothetical protein [Fuerstiella marisgermanici]APZ93216.1 hypothetical protein Fuma_02833 [Fuerstiella marisgermanici]